MEKNIKENVYICVWITLLYSRNEHNIIHQLYFNFKSSKNRFSSITQSCPTLCDPMDYSMPGFPALHYLLKFAQTHVQWVYDDIQPSHPLSHPSPPALSLSQHQGLFHWVCSLHQVAKVLELQLQYQPFQWIFRTDFLWDWLVWSICSPRDSQESSPAPQFKSIKCLTLSLLYGPALTSIHDYCNRS